MRTQLEWCEFLVAGFLLLDWCWKQLRPDSGWSVLLRTCAPSPRLAPATDNQSGYCGLLPSPDSVIPYLVHRRQPALAYLLRGIPLVLRCDACFRAVVRAPQRACDRPATNNFDEIAPPHWYPDEPGSPCEP